VGELIQFNRKKLFNVHQADVLLPLIIKITEAADSNVKSIINQLDTYPGTIEEQSAFADQKIFHIIDQWKSKIVKLGATPTNMWTADFDNGLGIYCWKFPEGSIQFSHKYLKLNETCQQMRVSIKNMK
jgi:hypothetical protein